MVSSDHLIRILEYKTQNSEALGVIVKLREIERKIRNIAAHQITPVSDSFIKEKTGYKIVSLNHADEYVKYSLADMKNIEKELSILIDEWRKGNTKFISKKLNR